eukprot:NODE_263_length_12530_cov_0.434881.p7 type:complete len:125 gc:universal NODE_263_length_12530_cov_0.434881:11622-11996(+)
MALQLDYLVIIINLASGVLFYYFTDMQRTVQGCVIQKSIDYIQNLAVSDAYAKRLSALTEQLMLERVKEIDPKIYNSLIQKSEKLSSSILECNMLGDQIIALCNELERIDSLLQVVASTNIDKL